jgi:hypothetical protein
MWVLLVHQGLQKELAGRSKKPADMSNEDLKDLNARALNTIRLCLADGIMFNIVEKVITTFLWSKMEILNFMMKSLTNKIYLKRKLYSL